MTFSTSASCLNLNFGTVSHGSQTHGRAELLLLLFNAQKKEEERNKKNKQHSSTTTTINALQPTSHRLRTGRMLFHLLTTNTSPVRSAAQPGPAPSGNTTFASADSSALIYKGCMWLQKKKTLDAAIPPMHVFVAEQVPPQNSEPASPFFNPDKSRL